MNVRWNVRKAIIISIIAVFVSSAVAVATWKIVDTSSGKSPSAAEGEAKSAEVSGAESGEAPPGEAGEAAQEGEADAAGVEASGLPSGETYSQTSPEQRYVTETQRHQNFFKALAEGRVRRLDAISTEYQPPGDPNTSYLYFTLTTSDGSKHNGTMVFKYEDGLWRIAAIRQLSGELGGGTNYVVPASFEADLAREIAELQEFFQKVAQGRLDYMVVDEVLKPSDAETVLRGRVVGIGGRVEHTQMTLRKDYNIWHLTDIRSIGG